MASSLFDKHHQLRSSLKAWLSFQPETPFVSAAITAHLSKGYRFNSGDLQQLTRMLDIQYELNRYSERGISGDITQLDVTTMSVLSPKPGIGNELSLSRMVTMPAWVRSIWVDAEARQPATGDVCAALVTSLLGEVSRLFAACDPSESTTVTIPNRKMPQLLIMSQCTSQEDIVATTRAVSGPEAGDFLAS
jgi:hypothetical protein